MRHSVVIALLLLLLAGAVGGCSSSKKEPTAEPAVAGPTVTGGSAVQRTLMQRILRGFAPTSLTRVRIAPLVRPFRDHHPKNAVMLWIGTADRTVRSEWEASLLTAVFRDRSAAETLPEVDAYVYPHGGEGFGETNVEAHPHPKPATSAEAAALRRLVRSAARRTGAKVLHLKTIRPYGLGVEVVLRVRHPAFFLHKRLATLMDPFAPTYKQREGEYVRIVGPNDQRVYEGGGWTRLSGGENWVRPKLRGCVLEIGVTAKYPPCPA